MKVKCIRASQSDGKLVVGRVYEVETESFAHYYLEGWWSKDRFEVVSESSAVPSEKTILQIGKIQGDAEEERCWQMMRPRVENGHCVCGCPKELCDYHRTHVVPATESIPLRR
jgi:hypothetical protein